jgi:hypothetical protein
MTRPLSVALTALALATISSAQFIQEPGSGCPGGSSITTAGTPKIGLSVTYTWICSSRSDVPFLLFRPESATLVLLPVPPACVAGCLLIHPVPLIVLAGQAGQGLIVTIAIPQDASLIGQRIRTQGACLTTSACIYLGLATKTNIY